MGIHILLAGEQLGPFSEIQVRQYLGEGLVSLSDLATYDGMEEWQSLDHLLANLGDLPVSAPDTETIVPDPASLEPTEPTAPADQAPESPSTMHNNAPEILEPASAPPSADSVPLPLTSTQKTKRSKIVIQPILPLEATAPISKRKPRSGKTALTLEPLRPTTALPPVSGFAPREKKPTKPLPLIRPEQLSTLRDFTKKTSATPPATSPPASVAPSNELQPQPAPTQPENRTESGTEKAWFQRIPPIAIYIGAALAFLIICAVFAYTYLLFAHHETTPAANPVNAPPPQPIHISAQPPDAVPQTAAEYTTRGLARQAKGELDGAILDFNQALTLDAGNINALYHRGLAFQSKGDLDGALADFTQVLTLDPKNADAFCCRGVIKQNKGDLDGALADYSQALLINPKIAAAYYNEGLIDAQKSYLDGAIADFNHALDLNPKLAVAYYNRGNAKNTEGNLDGAIADYTQAVTVNPKFAMAYYQRGFARQTNGNTDGALVDYAQAIALDSRMPLAYYNQGLLKMQQGDLEGALANINQAINLDPKNAPAYFDRGLARVGKGDLDGATADLKQFCGLVPRDGNADTARVYLWLLSTEENPQGHADQELSSALLNEWNSPPEDLTSKIAAFLLGHIRESELIANAASPDPSREPGQYCKVWYFAGMKRLLGGDMTTAIAYFQKCLATQQKGAYEYIFAQAELKALGQTRGVASKPAAKP